VALRERLRNGRLRRLARLSQAFDLGLQLSELRLTVVNVLPEPLESLTALRRRVLEVAEAVLHLLMPVLERCEVLRRRPQLLHCVHQGLNLAVPTSLDGPVVLDVVEDAARASELLVCEQVVVPELRL
jgi:hypothetical protein